MTLSDDELRAALKRRVAAEPERVDLVSAARLIAVHPAVERRPFRGRLIAVGSAAASVVVVLALAGALTQRGDTPASHLPTAVGTNVPTAPPSEQLSRPPAPA